MLWSKMFGTGIWFVAAAAALVLTGCSGNDGAAETPSPSTSDQPVIAGAPAGFDADDVEFAKNTIAHHEQSTELAALAPDRSEDPDLISLAAGIGAAETSDIAILQVFLVQWDQNLRETTVPGGPGNAVPGMVDASTVTRLQSLNGPDFDTLWVQTMIGHAQERSRWPKREVARGSNVDAVSTARRMIDSQQAQIGQLQQLLPAG